MRPPVLVVGCGVIGLSCALELQRAGFEVTIAARALPPDTVSNIAAAIWSPYAVAPRERCDAWAMVSYGVFQEHARDASSGVLLRSGIELYPANCPAVPLIRDLSGARAARPEELRPGFAAGIVFEAPVIETPVYLPWLVREFERGGGAIEVVDFQSLDEALERAPIVINCSGLGARELARDDSMFAIRGQIVRVERGSVEKFALDHDPSGGTTYVIPRSQDCVLGGTRDERNEDLRVDPRQSEDIVRRCATLVPEVAKSRALETLVGLRPGRPSVRLEVEQRARGKIVHNYGHGGGGVTLSWGCAREVLHLCG
ncbi:MAG TPA: FAD-dependent oxidoreductase [Planctomycetota bacterium]|nr:FAD-dependent oxidoreductase [Planctomycetota bacterium]